MLALSAGAWGFASVLATQVVIVIGMFVQHRTTKATYKAVNGVDEANGEPRLIDQVREHGRDIRDLKLMNEWKVGVLQQLAIQVGVRVPPLPETIKVNHQPKEHAA